MTQEGARLGAELQRGCNCTAVMISDCRPLQASGVSCVERAGAHTVR